MIFGCFFHSYGQLGNGTTRDSANPVIDRFYILKMAFCYKKWHFWGVLKMDFGEFFIYENGDFWCKNKWVFV
jgi:hypothetical protein